MKRFLASFASSNMQAALSRIRRQANQIGTFDEIHTLQEGDLDADFRKDFFDWMTPNVRGFGYWSWKPQTVLQVLREMKVGDALLYCDAGCHINPGGKERLLNYFNFLSDECPFVVFQNDPLDSVFNQENPNIGNWPNAHWTKGDLIDHFNARQRYDILEAQTLYATAFLLIKNETSEEVVNRWMQTIKTNRRLIDDSPSLSPNLRGFVEHRHDQAIFSLLMHDEPKKVISSCEIVYPKISGKGADWRKLHDFPIHARRDRGVGLKSRLREALSRARLI